MKIDILTLFPQMFNEIFNESIIKNAKDKNLLEINIFNLRDWSTDKHKKVDDISYGGGSGMVLKPDIIDRALYDLKSKNTKIMLLSPKGKVFKQKNAQKFAKFKHIIIICGHYSGVDHRVNKLIDYEISMGDFVLTGGEIPAMAITDAIARNVKGVINSESLINETHYEVGAQQYPLYTKPYEFIPKSKKNKALLVPKILISGNHAKISDWRKNQSK
jgi:tRNA (guanine37-N1)-methyltransferase